MQTDERFKPKWQRARILGDRNNPLFGRLLWVEIKPPTERNTAAWDSPTFFTGVRAVYQTNIVREDGIRCNAGALATELLPEFADDVPTIPMREFINGKD